ncbi:uncharacterized protein DMENIID0001_014020 [Sergentomyia squamirostris]
MKWTRHENIEFPQVWLKFKAKDPESGEIVNYQVEDLTEDRFDEVVGHMINYFIPDEPMCTSLNILKDEVSMAETTEMWQEAVRKKLTLVCFKESTEGTEGTREICALNILEVNEKEDGTGDVLQSLKGNAMRDIFTVFSFLKHRADVFNRYNVDKYLHGLGLLTLPKYRGCGLATEVLKARFPLMEALGLTLTCTVFSGPGSQGAARKANFTEDFVAPYESLGTQQPFVKFPNISWPVVKFMCYQLK